MLLMILKFFVITDSANSPLSKNGIKVCVKPYVNVNPSVVPAVISTIVPLISRNVNSVLPFEVLI